MDPKVVYTFFILIMVPTTATAIEVIKVRRQLERSNELLNELVHRK